MLNFWAMACLIDEILKQVGYFDAVREAWLILEKNLHQDQEQELFK